MPAGLLKMEFLKKTCCKNLRKFISSGNRRSGELRSLSFLGFHLRFGKFVHFGVGIKKNGNFAYAKTFPRI